MQRSIDIQKPSWVAEISWVKKPCQGFRQQHPHRVHLGDLWERWEWLDIRTSTESQVELPVLELVRLLQMLKKMLAQVQVGLVDLMQSLREGRMKGDRMAVVRHPRK